MTYPLTSPFTDYTFTNKAQLDVLVAGFNTVAPIARQMGRSATFSVADSTWTGMATWDLGALWNVGDIAYSAGVMTVGTSALYRWSTTIDWPATTTTHQRLQAIYVGPLGGTLAQTSLHEGKNSWHFTGSVGTLSLSNGGDIVLNATDTIQLYVYQNSGGTLVLNPRTFTLRR